MNEIINSKSTDLEKIAVCHRSAFPDSLSSKMGITYLKKMIEWYITDEKRFLFHIEENEKCIGYCGGMIQDGTEATGSASGMIQYSFNEAIKAIMLRPWLLFHKELISKYRLIYKNFKMRFKKKDLNPKKKPAGKKPEVKERKAGLVVIGVSANYQGKGFGSVLLREFENRAKEKKINLMELTVRNDNAAAIKSYERNGWVRFKLAGNSLEMHKNLN
ncbi:MAG: GNAT family N-acetyltransferase [Ignavibacteria bacterium]|nr:GNAT family N-acetyltransferase [Ignavibacteria bacterium]